MKKIMLILFAILGILTSSYAEMVQKPILGLSKEEIIERFKGWERNLRFETQVRPNALKFENPDLIVVVSFNKQGIAEGVAFLSQDISDSTGKNSYVNRNYQALINLATGGKKVKIKNKGKGDV